MNQASARMALRAALLLSAFLTVIGMVIYVAGDGLLPKELADWKAGQDGADEGNAVILFLLAVPLIGLLVASYAGMFMYKKWAAWLYLVLELVGCLLNLQGPNVESGLAAFISETHTLLAGAILGLAFFSSALEPDQNS
ncbi:MAG: hypothetical protein WCP67_08250 [Verrucomicrobiota bacterium]